ncbi:hypothetical protein ACOSP7_016464 [Xanthoceras sorbifolium]
MCDRNEGGGVAPESNATIGRDDRKNIKKKLASHRSQRNRTEEKREGETEKKKKEEKEEEEEEEEEEEKKRKEREGEREREVKRNLETRFVERKRYPGWCTTVFEYFTKSIKYL